MHEHTNIMWWNRNFTTCRARWNCSFYFRGNFIHFFPQKKEDSNENVVTSMFLLSLNFFDTNYQNQPKVFVHYISLSAALVLFGLDFYQRSILKHQKTSLVINLHFTMAGHCPDKRKSDQNLPAWSFPNINISTSVKSKGLWQLCCLCLRNYKAEDKLQ